MCQSDPARQRFGDPILGYPILYSDIRSDIRLARLLSSGVGVRHYQSGYSSSWLRHQCLKPDVGEQVALSFHTFVICCRNQLLLIMDVCRFNRPLISLLGGSLLICFLITRVDYIAWAKRALFLVLPRIDCENTGQCSHVCLNFMVCCTRHVRNPAENNGAGDSPSLRKWPPPSIAAAFDGQLQPVTWFKCAIVIGDATNAHARGIRHSSNHSANSYVRSCFPVSSFMFYNIFEEKN